MKHTLKSNGAFQRLYRKGSSAGTGRMVIYVRPNRLEENRLGFTVSTKLGKAVVRNRIRRRLREVCRLSSGQLKCGYDIVVVARYRSLKAPFSELREDYIRLMGKLGVLAQ